MRKLRISWTGKKWFAGFCFVSIFSALLLGGGLLVFGSRLNPESANYRHGDSPAYLAETLSNSNDVVKRCLEAQKNGNQTQCSDLKAVLEILRGSLNLSVRESIAGSSSHLSEIAYWQYLLTGSAVALLLLVVAAFYAFLYEANQAGNVLRSSLQATKDSREAELQPFLNIVDVSVQTGDPPFGGGQGWIDITLKNYGKTPARNFRNHLIKNTSDQYSSRYVEMLDGAPVVHTIKSREEGGNIGTAPDTILLDIINGGEERTVRCPVVTDILDREVKRRYMEAESGRRIAGERLPCFEGYRIQGSFDFSNFFYVSTTRRLYFELSESVDEGKSFVIIEDTKLNE